MRWFVERAFVFSFLLLFFAGSLRAAEKHLRVAFGDNHTFPIHLLQAGDLVCVPAKEKVEAGEPEIRLSKFMDTSKMTSAALARRKEEGFGWICYDNENVKNWPTPKTELADPTRYTIVAARATHAAGLKFLAEPNFELLVGRGSRGKNGRLELTDKQVPSIRLKEVAPLLDGISLQLQRAQGDVELYSKLTRQLAGEVRAANPKALVFVQVTAREKAGKQSSPEELMVAIRAVAPLVDGVWIHLDNGQEEFGVKLMELMAKEGYR